MVAVTVKYQKAGVRPPVFVAGSFSDPEWVPREMDWVLDDRGDGLFTKEVEVQEDREYQYKFKVGLGNDWDLDEQSPTGSDNMGNTNNLLTVSSSSYTASHQDSSTAGDAQPSSRIMPTLSEIVKPSSFETSQTTENKQKNKDKPVSSMLKGAPRLVAPEEEAVEAAVPATPLFAHETLGACDSEVVDDGLDHSLSPSVSRGMSVSSFEVPAPDNLTPDANDPTLELFPCDKPSVLNTLRRISTSMDEGPIQLDDQPASPRLASRRDSIDSATDSVPSPGSLSPTSSRKRDSRLSHSSVDRVKSATSLGSIVEEPPRDRGNTNQESKPFCGDDNAIGSTSDEDYPQIKDHKVYTACFTNESRDSQASSVAFSSKTSGKTSSRSSKSKKQGSWQVDGGSPIEGRWFITGGVVLLALAITWWKSYRV